MGFSFATKEGTDLFLCQGLSGLCRKGHLKKEEEEKEEEKEEDGEEDGQGEEEEEKKKAEEEEERKMICSMAQSPCHMYLSVPTHVTGMIFSLVSLSLSAALSVHPPPVSPGEAEARSYSFGYPSQDKRLLRECLAH